ncbi:MAG: hypothetical protein RI907_3270 [Pseudomonadota bacterium]|jgi:hypothetical chaperone protein
MTAAANSFCAIDFGTSNSAIAISAGPDGGMRLVPLESGQLTMPTAVFYATDPGDLPAAARPGPSVHDALPRCVGRAAIAAYIDGHEGRLMRSMKSVLGSGLVEQTTEVGGGHGVKFIDVITGYLRHLRDAAQAAGGQPLDRVVMGRPVHFVDDDATRDALAQSQLEAAARAVGFTEVRFQFEPIAAAFDHERHLDHEECVLVADIGGGTSDFSVVRVGPQRALRTERRDDILANGGVHIAGTDFDRHLDLMAIMPTLGLGAFGPTPKDGSSPRPVPSKVYFDLSTWHLVNTVYAPQRMIELRGMADFYGNPVHHQRLMKVLRDRLGHALLGQAEAAKIAVAEGGDTALKLDDIERGLAASVGHTEAEQAWRDDIARIVQSAQATVAEAGLQPDQVDALYFTGGSTGLVQLTDAVRAAFPTSRVVRGDRLASVATGLGLHAARVFG